MLNLDAAIITEVEVVMTDQEELKTVYCFTGQVHSLHRVRVSVLYC